MLFNLCFLSLLDCQLRELWLCRASLYGPILLYPLHLTDPFLFSSLPSANPFLLSSPPHTHSPSILISLPHVFSLSLIHTPLSVPSNLSPALAPPLSSSQDSIIYSSLMLCMIWAIDEAISLSPLRALPSLSLSPCCLMFQFGGSKHSIRQINCLMHVISQTVYERGAPRPGAASPPPTAATSFSLPCSPRAHCLLSYRQAHPGSSRVAAASVCTYTHAHKWKTTYIYSCTHTNTDLYLNCACVDTQLYAGSYTQESHMHEKPHSESHINIVWAKKRMHWDTCYQNRKFVPVSKVHGLHETFHVIPMAHILMC